VDRRNFLKLFSAGTVAAMSGQLVQKGTGPVGVVPFEDIDASVADLANSIRLMSSPAPSLAGYLDDFSDAERATLATTSSPRRGHYLAKMEDFERTHIEDVYLDREDFTVLISSFRRLDRVQNLVGHGNFNIVSFDAMLRYGRGYSSVGQFSKAETDFIEKLFEADPVRYGFYGDKVVPQLTSFVPVNKRVKVDSTGHHLYRGQSESLYVQLQKDLGGSVVLTSGIRGVVKQMHLFLAKTIQARGNLSRASRSLAPPGHSYHGIGDFDVGKVGFGRRNFTEDFARTEEYRRLVDLGYVDIRYPRGNGFGVRFEPWHIKVV
jgi:hypothetical protein